MISTLRSAAVLLLALGVACSSSAPAVGARLRSPSAVTVFQGVTAKRPGAPSPYVAVANAGRSELTLVDAVDDRVVVSPGLVFPLSVPVPSRPALLASASLHDGGADLLVAVASPFLASPAADAGRPWEGLPDGAIPVHVVDTWSGEPTVAASLAATDDLAAIALAALGVPVPQDAAPRPEDGVVPPEAGRARLLVALTGGRLAVFEATRAGEAVALAPVAELTLGFDAEALAASPDGRRVYAATLDPIVGTGGGAPVFGVAEIDTLGDPQAWTVRALDAKLPTTGVAAARVVERAPADDEGGVNPDDFIDAQMPWDVRPLYVYALPEWSRCGPGEVLDCGVLTVDPVTGTLAADPLGELPYRAPMPLPAAPLAIAAWDRPPQVDAEFLESPTIPFHGITVAPGTGLRSTSAIAAVTAADGLTYYLDLGRFGPGLNTSILRPSSNTRVEDPRILTDLDAPGPQLGIWSELDRSTGLPSEPLLVTTSNEMRDSIRVMPGYTRDDRWAMGFQLGIPGLVGRAAVLAKDAGEGLVLALQEGTVTAAAPPWRDVAPVYDPRFGLRVDDVVELRLDAGQPCTGQGEARIAAILAPDAERWPGGALRLGPPVDPDDAEDAQGQPIEDRAAVYGCWEATAPVGAYAGTASVLAGGWVLVGQAFGYAGRPVPEVRYALDYPSPQDGLFPEEELLAACTIPEWPAAGPVPACEGACRTACEELALARKTRRYYYPQDSCDAQALVACDVSGQWIGFETYAPGPVLEFRFGILAENVDPPGDGPTFPITRFARIEWDTRAGFNPAWRATSGAGLATGIVGFDRSPWTKRRSTGVVFYQSHAGNLLYEAAFSGSATESKTIR